MKIMKEIIFDRTFYYVRSVSDNFGALDNMACDNWHQPSNSKLHIRDNIILKKFLAKNKLKVICTK